MRAELKGLKWTQNIMFNLYIHILIFFHLKPCKLKKVHVTFSIDIVVFPSPYRYDMTLMTQLLFFAFQAIMISMEVTVRDAPTETVSGDKSFNGTNSTHL